MFDDPDEEPTDRQLRFAQELGIRIPRGVSKYELSRLIDEAKYERDLQRARRVRAQLDQVDFVASPSKPRKAKSSGISAYGCLGVLIAAGLVAAILKVGSTAGKPPAPTLSASSPLPASPAPMLAPAPAPKPAPVPSLVAMERAGADRSARLAHFRITPEYRALDKAVTDSFASLCAAHNGGTPRQIAAAQDLYQKATVQVSAAEEQELTRQGKLERPPSTGNSRRSESEPP